MKYSIRIACLAATAFLCAPRVEAQVKPFSFGVYAEAGFPTGSMSNSNTTGYGAGINAEVKLPASLSATASFGFMHFGGSDVVINGVNAQYPALNAFPLRVGAKYRLKVFYVALETGAVFSSLPDKNDFSKDRTTGLLAPAIGVRFANIDIRGKYESWLDANGQFWGLQASLKF
ncbi:MAG: hypothetical protein EOO12_08610 [Chitinophagaceae bacterium]|nr:MAG: hypothetical protein EOO12_08610 [Chitinophagaceae bacterium]